MTKWRGIPAVPPSEVSLYSLLSAIKDNLEIAINEIDGGSYSGKSASIKISLQNVNATMGSLSASITNEATVRATADDALAQQIQALIVSGSSAVMTYAQATAPSSPNLGDIWFNTSDNNRVFRYSGSSWVAVEDLRTIANTSAISTEQSARINGDNALASSITSLTSLVNTQDATLQANITSEASTRASADSALSTSITNLTSTVNSQDATLQANINTEASTRATADSANASAISAVSAVANLKARTFYQSTTPVATAIGDLWINTGDSNKVLRWDGTSWVAADDTRIASVVTQSSANATAIGDINAQYSVTVSAGKVTGFKLISSPTTSDFIVQADKFQIENATGVPFKVVGSDVYINDNKVGTSSVVNNAITSPVSAFTTSAITLTSGTDTTVQQATIDYAGTGVVVITVGATVNASSSYYTPIIYNVYRDSTQIASLLMSYNSVFLFTQASIQDAPPSAGTYTYYFKIAATFTGSGSAENRSLLLLGAKK